MMSELNQNCKTAEAVHTSGSRLYHRNIGSLFPGLLSDPTNSMVAKMEQGLGISQRRTDSFGSGLFTFHQRFPSVNVEFFHVPLPANQLRVRAGHGFCEGWDSLLEESLFDRPEAQRDNLKRQQHRERERKG
jgi:hypothetical protein